MASTDSFDEITEQPPISKPQSFDYDSLDSSTRIIVQQRTSEIKSLLRKTSQDIIDIGQKLTEVKQQLGHGHFRNWLKAEFEWGIWIATKFMQVADRFKGVNFTHLQVSASALYILAAPSTPELASKEALKRATQGEVISHSKAKTIVNQHKASAKLQVPQSAIAERLSTEFSPQLQTLALHSPVVVARSEHQLSEIETEAIAQLQASHCSETLATDSSERSPQDQAEVDMYLPLGVGDLIYFTDVEQQESKLLGEVAEVKEMTATEVIIKISFCGSDCLGNCVSR